MVKAGHEGRVEEGEERRLVEGKWDSMGDGYKVLDTVKETVLTKPIDLFNECISMKVSVGPEK